MRAVSTPPFHISLLTPGFLEYHPGYNKYNTMVLILRSTIILHSYYYSSLGRQHSSGGGAGSLVTGKVC